MFLLKILAVLIGLPLTLGGFGGFWYGLYVAFLGEGGLGMGILIVIGSVLALALGTALGQFARGDYD